MSIHLQEISNRFLCRCLWQRDGYFTSSIPHVRKPKTSCSACSENKHNKRTSITTIKSTHNQNILIIIGPGAPCLSLVKRSSSLRWYVVYFQTLKSPLMHGIIFETWIYMSTIAYPEGLKSLTSLQNLHASRNHSLGQQYFLCIASISHDGYIKELADESDVLLNLQYLLGRLARHGALQHRPLLTFPSSLPCSYCIHV